MSIGFYINTGHLQPLIVGEDVWVPSKDMTTEERHVIWHRSSDKMVAPGELVEVFNLLLTAVSYSRFTHIGRAYTDAGVFDYGGVEDDGILTNLQVGKHAAVFGVEVRISTDDSDDKTAARLGAAGFLVAKADLGNQRTDLAALIKELEVIVLQAVLLTPEGEHV